MNRNNMVKKASVLGIIGNIFLLIIKGAIGFLTNSQAMIADFFNSAGDVFSSIMTFIGNKIASVPNDEDHNLGHGKAEYIYSMLISIVMLLTSFLVFKDSFISIFKINNIVFSGWLIIVCLTTIAVKLLLYIYTNNMSHKLNNLLLKTNSLDHRNDCVVTTLNLLSCILSINGIHYIDGITGCIISICLFISAIKIFKESYDILIDKSMNEEQRRQIYDIIKNYKDIKKVTHFNSTPVGYKYQISFSIFVDENMTTKESHAIADKLEKEIANTIDDIYLTVIHVNPI